jgi:LPPG:FO 2-phospho-L-lactate transferase
VAQAYRDFLDLLIVDNSDSQMARQLEGSGLRVECTSTVMKTIEDKVRLARAVLQFVSGEEAGKAVSEFP